MSEAILILDPCYLTCVFSQEVCTISLFPVSWEPRVVCAWGRVCFSLCARKPSSLALMAFVLGYVRCSCWLVLASPPGLCPTPPQPHSPTLQMLFLGLLLLRQGAASLTFSLLFSFSYTFIPSSSSCSPSTGCCLSLLRHQFLVLLGAESQALPCEPLHRGGHRRSISCPRSLARASGSGSRELACRPGEFAADSRHYAC